MRTTRLVAAGAATSLLAFGPLAGFAAADAAPKGVGTGTVSSTALSIQLGANGDLLSIRVLGDDGSSTIDPAKGTPVSSSTLRPLTVSSKTVPALNLALPAVTSRSTGAEDKKSVAPAVPSSPAASGRLNAALSSIVDAAGARSGLAAGLANLGLAGGLVEVPTGSVQVASKATGGSASGSRMITIPEVRVLDLSAVLDGLGLELTDLSVTQVLGLLKSLGIQLPDIVDPAAAVASLNTAIDTAQAATGPITAQLCATIDGLLDDTLGGLGGLGDTVGDLPQVIGGVTGELPVVGGGDSGGLPIVGGGSGGGGGTLPGIGGGGGLLGGLQSQALLPEGFSCSNITGTVQDLVDTLQSTLGMLLVGALVELGDTALLSVKDVRVGIETLATESVSSSVADVTASIGQVRVGELPVPGVSGLDLAVPAAALNQATEAIQGAVSGVLSSLNAGLADLVKVELLDIDKVVSEAGDYVTAASTVTALRATVTPPTDLLRSAALLDLTGDPVTEILETVTTTVPTIAPAMGALEAALGGIEALSAPLTVTVGQLSANAAFRPAAAQVAPGEEGGGIPGGELPRTGGDAALPAMAAVLLAGAALAIRRVVRSSLV